MAKGKTKQRDDWAGPLPPQNLEAEQALLGALLLNPVSTIADIRAMVEVDAFYTPQHRAIFKAICDIFDAGLPSDVHVLEEAMKRNETFAGAGGRDYLIELVESVPSAANAIHYAGIVREKHRLRQLVDVGWHLQQQAMAPDAEADDLIRRIELRMMQEAGQLRKRRVMTPGDARQVIQRILSGNVDQGLSTGFDFIDRKIGGLREGDLVVLAARPGVGKTAMAIQIARHVAVAECVPVAFLSLEMRGEAMIRRMLSQQLRIGGGKLKHPDRLSDADRVALVDYAPPDNLYLIEAGDMTIGDLRAEARRYRLEWDIGLLVIDYLGLIDDPAGAKQTRAVMVGNISRAVKGLARELNIPVIALHSLNRGSVHDNRIPELHDLRDSGQIDHDADVVMLLHNKTTWEKSELPPATIEVFLKFAKNREGELGLRTIDFTSALTAFCIPDPELELAATRLPQSRQRDLYEEPGDSNAEAPF